MQIAGFSGILVGFIGGSYLPYAVNPVIMIFIPVVFLVGFFWFPESPQFLLKNNSIEVSSLQTLNESNWKIVDLKEAEKSLQYYRNVKTTDDDFDQNLVNEEFTKLKAIAKINDLQPPLEVSDFGRQILNMFHQNCIYDILFIFVSVNSVALRAIIICPFLMAVNQFSGSFAISTYAETIFKSTGSTVDPQMSSIVMAVVQVIGTYTASQLMDRAGRKVLLLVSLSGGCVMLLITGTYSYLAKHDYDVSSFNWVPIVTISSFLFLSAIGIIPVPFTMLSEVIPPKVSHLTQQTILNCIIILIQYRFDALRVHSARVFHMSAKYACYG